MGRIHKKHWSGPLNTHVCHRDIELSPRLFFSMIQDESDGLAQTLNGIDLKRKSIEAQAGKTI